MTHVRDRSSFNYSVERRLIQGCVYKRCHALCQEGEIFEKSKNVKRFTATDVMVCRWRARTRVKPSRLQLSQSNTWSSIGKNYKGVGQSFPFLRMASIDRRRLLNAFIDTIRQLRDLMQTECLICNSARCQKVFIQWACSWQAINCFLMSRCVQLEHSSTSAVDVRAWHQSAQCPFFSHRNADRHRMSEIFW